MIKRKHLFALGSTMLLGVAGVASAETSDVQAMKAEMAAMKAEIANLKGQSNENWLNERRAEEVKALVRDVLADADTRASLMAAGATAGHDGKRFFLASEDGNFRLNIGGQIQIRWDANWNNPDTVTTTTPSIVVPGIGTIPGSSSTRTYTTNSGAPDNFESGFAIRRTKLQFDGYIGSPKFGYKVVLAAARENNTYDFDSDISFTSTRDGWVGVEEAVIDYKVLDNLTVYAGRTKAPFLREELVSSRRQLAAERSQVAEAFTTGFVEGVGFVYSGWDAVRINGMIHDGSRSGELSNANKAFDADTTDIAATGRVDVKIMGDWAQLEEFTSWSGDPSALFVGAAVHYEEGETGSPANNNNFLMWTADVLYKNGGFNAFGSATGAHSIKSEGGTSTYDSYGFVAQAGYQVIPDKLEPFARYEFFYFDEDNGAHQAHVVTVGANYYILRHAAKITADVAYSFNALNSNSVGSINQNTVGFFNENTRQDQVAIRLQFQLLF